MKTTKRLLAIVMAVVSFVSVMGIAAEAASVSLAKLNLGYMAPTNSKGTKIIETVKLYGDYDYINFYISSKKKNSYFFYEIYSDKDLTKGVESGYVYCNKGEYAFSQKIKLKGKYKSKTYYLVTYAAKIYSDGSAKIDKKSMREFKIKVDRKPDFDEKVVVLKNTKNTTKGAYIKWGKLSDTKKYEIYRRSITGTKWKKVGTVSSKKTTFTDASVKNKNGNYIYSVKAVNKKGTKSRMLYSGLTCLFAKTPVMKSVSVIGNNTVQVKWGSTKSGAKYNVMRKEPGGSWATIATNYSGTTYNDKTAVNGRKYTYSVKAVISTSYGKATSSYYANDDKVVTYLKAPTLNSVTKSENGLNIKWSAVAGASTYKICRMPLDKSESWRLVGTVGSGTLTFTDKTASADGSYIYTVRADSAKNKGSYYSSGINYIELAKPEITSTGIYSYNDYHSVSWGKIKYATEYYLYKRNSQNEWELVGVFDATDSSTQTARVDPEKYVLTEYCVQAGYNGNVRSKLSDPAFIDEYPYSKYVAENRVEYNYIKILVNSKADKYNVYKVIEDTEEHKLVATFDVTDEKFFEYKDYDFAEKSTYVVKGVFNGEEQLNFKTFSVLRGEEPAESRDESVFCESYSKDGFKVEITHPEYDDYYARYYFYDYGKSNWVEVSSHYINGDTHYIYEDDFPEYFECSPDGEYKLSIIYSKKGENKPTAVDANIMTFKRIYTPIKNFTAATHKNGAKITWSAVDGVSKYIVNYTVDDVTKTVEIVADGSDKYTAVMEADIDTTGHINYFPIIICEYTENYVSRHNMPEIEQCGTPKINKTKYYSTTGIAELYFGEHEGTSCEYTIYRKEKGGASWTVVQKHASEEAYSAKYGEAVWDRSAKPGKTYVYTLRASSRFKSSDNLILLESYYDETGKTLKT